MCRRDPCCLHACSDVIPQLPHRRQLNHPRIVKLLGACVRAPKMCFIMELCPSSLFKLLHETRARLTDQQRIDYASQCADAVGYLHSRRPGVIHRDIKSHNLLIDETNQVCVSFLCVCLFVCGVCCVCVCDGVRALLLC